MCNCRSSALEQPCELNDLLQQPNSTQPKVGWALFSYDKPNHKPKPKPTPTFSQLLHNQTQPNSGCNLVTTQLEDACQKKLSSQPNSTQFFSPDRTIISFVQPQPNSIQNKNNPIGCGTAPGNLVSSFALFFFMYYFSLTEEADFFMATNILNQLESMVTAA